DLRDEGSNARKREESEHRRDDREQEKRQSPTEHRALSFERWMSKKRRTRLRTPSRSWASADLERWSAAQQTSDQTDHEQHQEDEEQQPRDLDRYDGDAGKAEHARNERDDQENKSPVKHGLNLRTGNNVWTAFRVPKAVGRPKPSERRSGDENDD